jgi:hypothetical protein
MTLLLAFSVLLASPCHLAAPEFFLSGVLKLVCFFTLFVFVTWGPAWEQRGNIESVSRTGPNPLFMQDGEEGNIENLGLVPYSHLNYFHLFIRVLGVPCLDFPSEARG